MRRGLRRVIVVTALGAVGLFGSTAAVWAETPITPGPEPGSPEQMDYFADFCRHEMQRPPTAAPGVGHMDNITSPGPGTAVAGDVIGVNLRWDPTDFDDSAGVMIEKVLNCVSINGTPVPELTDEERPTLNDGAYDREFVVPQNVESGLLLCEQGFVYGNLSRGGYSQISSPRVCFTTEAAAAPPPPPPPPATAPPTTVTTAEPTTTTTVAAAPERVAAGEPAPAPAPAPAKKELPKTGPGDRGLLIGAGVALGWGGFAVALGARRRSASLS
jgi:hypothetical protein